jgi:phospholipid transport system substrate-binding protein
MKNFWFIVLICLVVTSSVSADGNAGHDPNELFLAKWNAVAKKPEPSDPNKMLQAKWNAITEILETKNIDQKLKEKAIDIMISPTFDFPLMAKLTLGKANWSKLNRKQREKFTDLFIGHLKDSYRNKTRLYSDEKFFFEPAVKKKSTIQIPMVLISADKKISIVYKLHETDKHWMIYDVEIQGVSIIITYRSQFNDILINGTFDDLIWRLEKTPAQ